MPHLVSLCSVTIVSLHKRLMSDKAPTIYTNTFKEEEKCMRIRVLSRLRLCAWALLNCVNVCMCVCARLCACEFVYMCMSVCARVVVNGRPGCCFRLRCQIAISAVSCANAVDTCVAVVFLCSSCPFASKSNLKRSSLSFLEMDYLLLPRFDPGTKRWKKKKNAISENRTRTLPHERQANLPFS